MQIFITSSYAQMYRAQKTPVSSNFDLTLNLTPARIERCDVNTSITSPYKFVKTKDDLVLTN